MLPKLSIRVYGVGALIVFFMGYSLNTEHKAIFDTLTQKDEPVVPAQITLKSPSRVIKSTHEKPPSTTAAKVSNRFRKPKPTKASTHVTTHAPTTPHATYAPDFQPSDYIPPYTFSKSYPLIHNNPPLNCSESIYGTKFGMTAIHSFMGAGNTWSRYLIQQATGFLTGSSFNDIALRQNGFPGEGIGPKRFNMTIATKSHNINDATGEGWMFNYIEDKNNSNKCVIVVRNPFDTFMAEFARMKTGGHTASKNIMDDMSSMRYTTNFRTSFEAKSWYWNGAGLPEKTHEENFHKKKAKGFAGRWLRSYYNAYNYCTNHGTFKGNNTEKTALLVLYENLKRNKVSELLRISKYLGQYHTGRFEECVVKKEKMEGNFHRSKHMELNVFNETAVNFIREMVLTLNETLKILPQSYLKNPYEGKLFFTDAEIWDKGACRVGDSCFGILPGEKERTWFKFGSHKEVCDILLAKRELYFNHKKCEPLEFLGKNVTCLEMRRFNCQKYRQ